MNLLAMIPITTTSLPQPQGQASTASTGVVPSLFHADAPSAASPNQTNNNTSQTSGHAGSDTDTTSRSGNSQFGKLLASKQPENSSPSPAKTTTTSDTIQPEQDASLPFNEASNQTATALMALLLQMQQIAPQPTNSAQVDGNHITLEGNETSTSDSAPPLKDLLSELAALLKQALQGQTSENTTTVSPMTNTLAQQTASDTDEPETVPSDLMALILAFLQQQNATTPAIVSEPAASESSTISTSTQQSSPTQQLTAALTQLASLLDQQAPAQTISDETTDTADISLSVNDVATPVNTVPAQSTAAGQTPISAKPDVKTAKVNDATTTAQPSEPSRISPELQQAIAHVVDALGQKDALPTQQSADRQDTSNDTATAMPAVTSHTQSPVQNTDFIKHVQHPASTPNMPVVDQVLVQIKNTVNDGSSQIRIQLHPEDLGKVDVQMNTSADGKTTVTISSDNRNTLALLQNEARALQDALRDIGLKTDAGGLNFNLRDSGQDARNSSKQQQGGYTNVAGVQEIDDDYELSTTGTLYRISVQQGLDIRV